MVNEQGDKAPYSGKERNDTGKEAKRRGPERNLRNHYMAAEVQRHLLRRLQEKEARKKEEQAKEIRNKIRAENQAKRQERAQHMRIEDDNQITPSRQEPTVQPIRRIPRDQLEARRQERQARIEQRLTAAESKLREASVLPYFESLADDMQDESSAIEINVPSQENSSRVASVDLRYGAQKIKETAAGVDDLWRSYGIRATIFRDEHIEVAYLASGTPPSEIAAKVDARVREEGIVDAERIRSLREQEYAQRDPGGWRMVEGDYNFSEAVEFALEASAQGDGHIDNRRGPSVDALTGTTSGDTLYTRRIVLPKSGNNEL